MTEDEATPKKARRAILLLYGIMVVFIIVPFVIYFLRRS